MSSTSEFLKTYWKDGLLIAVGLGLVIAGNTTEVGVVLTCPGTIAALLGFLRIGSKLIGRSEEEEFKASFQAIQILHRRGFQEGYLAGLQKGAQSKSDDSEK